MSPINDSFLLIRSEPICIQAQVETFIETFICGYNVKTIHDYVMNEFKMTIYWTLEGTDTLELHKYEKYTYSHKSALNMHVNALSYINICFEKKGRQ